jgi:hypothetical protein
MHASPHRSSSSAHLRTSISTLDIVMINNVIALFVFALVECRAEVMQGKLIEAFDFGCWNPDVVDTRSFHPGNLTPEYEGPLSGPVSIHEVDTTDGATQSRRWRKTHRARYRGQLPVRSFF